LVCDAKNINIEISLWNYKEKHFTTENMAWQRPVLDAKEHPANALQTREYSFINCRWL